MEYGQIPGVEKKISRIVHGLILLKILERENSFRVLDVAFDEGNTFIQFMCILMGKAAECSVNK